MWEFAGAADEPKFLIIARTHRGQKTGTSPEAVPLEGLSAELRERLILYGSLAELDYAGQVGIAIAVHARDNAAVDALLGAGRVGLDVFSSIEKHDWTSAGDADQARE